MSSRYRGKLLADPQTRTIPLPAGGVKLETFVPWTLITQRDKGRVIPPPGACVAFTRTIVTPRANDAAKRNDAPPTPLVRALGLAHHWQRVLDEEKATSVKDIAEAEGIAATLVHRALRLTLLAPDVIENMLTTPKLSAEKVLSRKWPFDWNQQRAALAELRAARAG
jgi:hypothetical protein